MNDTRDVILIVDDVELNRAILHDLFCRDFRIVEAENGEKAISLIRQYQNELAIVLLDIIMPVVDGFGVLQYIANQGWQKMFPVFLITAEDSDRVIERGYDMGVTDIIQKPFNPAIIRRRVQNTIELFQHRYQMEHLIEFQSEELKRQAMQLKSAHLSMIDVLSTVIEFRDCESGQHIQRIRNIAKILLMQLSAMYPEYRLTLQKIDEISVASALHDIGKIAIPDYILNKPGKLTEQEFEIMKEHTVRGCEILDRIDSIHESKSYPYYYDICRWHHEKWDGNGYPDGLKGEEIPIWAQVISLADCYDALVSKRVYKPPFSHEQAAKIILDGECGVFNPKLINSFINASEQLKESAQQNDTADTARYLRPKPEVTQEPALQVDGPKSENAVSDRTLRLLEMERERYRVLSEISQDIIFTYYSQTDTALFSGHYAKLFQQDETITNAMETLRQDERIEKRDRQQLFELLDRLSPECPFFRTEMRILLPNHEKEWFEVFVYSIWDRETPPNCMSLIGKLSSIDERKAEINRWKHQASTDSLTGLLNREALRNSTEQLFAVSSRNHSQIAFMMLDVDNFKQINDSLGHQAGDQVLCIISQVIQSCLRSTDLVGRIGGDEFAAVLSGVDSREVIAKKAAQICNTVQNFLPEEARQFHLSVSIGIALFPQDALHYESLLQKADIALYAAKYKGKNTFLFYQDSLLE